MAGSTLWPKLSSTKAALPWQPQATVGSCVKSQAFGLLLDRATVPQRQHAEDIVAFLALFAFFHSRLPLRNRASAAEALLQRRGLGIDPLRINLDFELLT